MSLRRSRRFAHMGKDIQVQISPEEIRLYVESIVTALARTTLNCRPIDDLVTVEDRCKQRWPTATRKNRQRVRDVCLNIYRQRLGRHPYKLTGHLNGTFAVEREHLDILDLAIDRVRDDVDPPDGMPLFS